MVKGKTGLGRVGQVVCQPGSISGSQLVLRSKANKQISLMKRIGAPIVRVDQVSGQLNTLPTSAGQQAIFCVNVYGQDINSYCGAQYPNTYFGGAQDIQPGPRRYVHESLISELNMTNSQSSGIEMEIYDIVCKRDVPTNNVILVNGTQQGTLAAANGPPLYWGYGVQAGNGAQQPYYQYLGSSPYDSQFFRDYFKTLRRTRVFLPQGATHRHVVNLSPNKIMDETLYNSTVMWGFKGLTVYTMVVIKGLPVSRTFEADFNNGATTTDSVFLNWVQNRRFKWTWVQNQQNTAQYTNNMLPLTQEPPIVNIGSGLVTPTAKTLYATPPA